MMRSILWSFLVLALFLAGCSSNSVAPSPVGRGPQFPNNDTPQHAISRLLATYEGKAVSPYQGLFTGDFSFEFSNSTDPSLVQQYSTGWSKNDEKESAAHLFSGYTPAGQPAKPAASAIDLRFATTEPSDDNGSADPRTHKVLQTRVDGTVAIPEAGSEPLDLTLTNNLDVIWLVRGDAAVGLDSTQPADSTHWYVYRWVDLTQSSPSPTRGPMAAQSATWGRLKALYR
jgi:hypothetical protein